MFYVWEVFVGHLLMYYYQSTKSKIIFFNSYQVKEEPWNGLGVYE